MTLNDIYMTMTLNYQHCNLSDDIDLVIFLFIQQHYSILLYIVVPKGVKFNCTQIQQQMYILIRIISNDLILQIIQCAQHDSGITFVRYSQSQKIGKPNNFKVFWSKTTKWPEQDNQGQLRSAIYLRKENLSFKINYMTWEQ